MPDPDYSGILTPPMTPEQKERLARILSWKGEAIAPPAQVHMIPIISIPIVALKSVAKLPSKSHDTDAGWDLYVAEPATVLVDGMTDLHTNIAISLPPGYFGRITGRSSTLRRRGLLVNEGIVDSGYTGELFIAVFNLGHKPVQVERGERLAQLLINRVESVRWDPVKELPQSQRGKDGFGSTGR